MPRTRLDTTSHQADPTRLRAFTSADINASGPSMLSYEAPFGHLQRHFADPSYWEPLAGQVFTGDWLFVVHTVGPNRKFNAIYAFTSGPAGPWAQLLVSSLPPVGSSGP